MWYDKAKIEYICPDSRRILVVSDIHGNLPYFEGLLAKADYNPENDELIIDGDFLEKGDDCLGVLNKVIELCETGHVHVTAGNCDTWAELFDWGPEADDKLLEYFRRMKSGIIWEMSEKCGINLLELSELSECRRVLPAAFGKELAFLRGLNTVIESEHYIFAHSGLNKEKPLSENFGYELLKHDFYKNDAPLAKESDKWLIIGHTPVVLYRGFVDANPIIDEEKKIVCIDGGCVLKDDGQLNMLIIPQESSCDFKYISYDHFPTAVVAEDQVSGESSYYIRWGDNEVEVLNRDKEFSRIHHMRTGYEMDILTKYLFTNDRITKCNDCTDYILPLSAGDEVSIVEICSDRYFVKHKGISGWYFGKLK